MEGLTQTSDKAAEAAAEPNGAAPLRKPLLRRLGFALLRIVLLSWAGMLVVTAVFQSHFIYFPTRQIEGTPDDIALPYEDVFLTAEDGVRLHGWFVPAPQTRGAVLMCDGNAGNIGDRLETIQFFNQLRLDVLIFDYRGYGRSEGSPSEAGTYADARAGPRHLVHREGGMSRIILMGRSLGGAVAARTAADAADKPAGLIIESSFTSMPDLAGQIYWFVPLLKQLVRFKYDTREAVARAGCPVLVAHSREDELIKFRNGQAIYAAAPAPKQFLEMHGGHNDAHIKTGEAYVEAMDRFVSQCLGSN